MYMIEALSTIMTDLRFTLGCFEAKQDVCEDEDVSLTICQHGIKMEQ